ncbi:hypothetical protein PsYK624_005230 [Phanerochaete sordida]|uniref:Uncharacterized protein n=1 Tax=Phanerochaete sordida TaxID=48140 RepID=A0A9P3L891_9APHY|nr:hypothetical protein PsYK624_005230 [Phanerochaete sordida]
MRVRLLERVDRGRVGVVLVELNAACRAAASEAQLAPRIDRCQCAIILWEKIPDFGHLAWFAATDNSTEERGAVLEHTSHLTRRLDCDAFAGPRGCAPNGPAGGRSYLWTLTRVSLIDHNRGMSSSRRRCTLEPGSVAIRVPFASSFAACLIASWGFRGPSTTSSGSYGKDLVYLSMHMPYTHEGVGNASHNTNQGLGIHGDIMAMVGS